MSAAPINPSIPPAAPSSGPLADFLTQNREPQLHGWKKGLDITGQVLAPNLEQHIPGTEGNYQRRYGLAVQRQGQFDKERQTQAQIEQEEAKAIQERAAAKKALAPYKAESLTQQESDYVDEAVVGGMDRLEAIQRVTDATDKSKPQKLTNPFETFAYGTPEEKQAAQDFITFEKRIGQRYEKPGEIEQRYSLYQRDPEAYKAMFGERGAAQDQAQATRMLNYFDKRRREISGDWTLDETEKAKQLSELDDLQKPHMDAAGGSQAGDRVTVIHPNGTKGTIPRSQLKGAQKKGYRLAQ